MAYFVEHAQSGASGGITAIAQNMPAHQANDILIAHITVDSGTITVAGSAWAALPSAPANPVTQGTISYLYYVKAAGSAETLTLTTGDAYTCGIYCYRDVDGTTPFDGVTPKHAGVGTATTTPVNETITTGTADALVVFHIAQDGTTPQVLSDPGVMSIYNADSTGTTATTSSHQSAAWYIQRAVGATPVANWSSSVSAVYVRATFALRNASGGRIPAYLDDVTSPGTRLTAGHHVATQNNISYSASGSFVVTANIAGKTLTQAAAANGADFGINPYSNAVTSTAAATASTALTGQELVLTGGRDLSTGLICGSFIAGTPKQGAFGLGTIDQGGVVVRVASGATNWNAYQVAAKNSVPNPVQRCVFAIQPGYAGSDYDTGSSGSATTTSITYVQFLRNAPSFSSQVYMSELHQFNTQVVAGGDANFPVDTDGMAQVGESVRLPVIQKVGSAGLISLVPIQVGGGDAVNFQIDAGSLQFPRRADTLKKEIQFHGADNTLGISYAGKSGDVIKHTNSLISSPTPFYWEINSAATSAATWDFTGTSVIGANVTLRNVVTFDSMSFTSCPTLNFSGSSINNSNITKVPAANDTLTTTATTNIDNSTINVTGVTAGNRWCSVADPTIFSGCAFTGSSSTGHAIRITSPGTYSFVGNVFTSFGAIGTTSAAIFNDSGGLVTLNISGGGSSPTYRNGTNATTVVNNVKPIKVTVLDTNNSPIQGAQVWIQKRVGDTDVGHPGNPFTSTATGNNQGDPDFVVQESPPGDLPSAGWLAVQDVSGSSATEQPYRYASRSASTFTLNTAVTGTDNGTGNATTINETGIGAKNIIEGDTIRTTNSPFNWAVVLSVSANFVTTTALSGGDSWAGRPYGVHTLAVNYDGSDKATVPLMNEESNASGVATEDYNYQSADKDIVVRVRRSSTAEPQYLPLSTQQTITSTGLDLTVTLSEDFVR